jgi:hypothetical protein
MMDVKNKLCPRAFGKAGKRIKLALTLDEQLYNKVMDCFSEGYQVSHIVDSALWNFFEKPQLSFELEAPKKPKKKNSPTLFDEEEK